MHKESGLKWAGLVFGWTTLVGYISATMVYQVGSFSAHPQFSSAWIVGMVAVLALAIIALKRVGRNAVPSQLIPAVQLS
jgi:ferrous iron transport protein B